MCIDKKKAPKGPVKKIFTFILSKKYTQFNTKSGSVYGN